MKLGLYSTVNRHPIACLWGWAMGCLLGDKLLIGFTSVTKRCIQYHLLQDLIIWDPSALLYLPYFSSFSSSEKSLCPYVCSTSMMNCTADSRLSWLSRNTMSSSWKKENKYSAVALRHGQFSLTNLQQTPIACPWGRGMGYLLWV